MVMDDSPSAPLAPGGHHGFVGERHQFVPYWGLVLNSFACNTSPGFPVPLSRRCPLPRKSDVETPKRGHPHIYEMSAVTRCNNILSNNLYSLSDKEERSIGNSLDLLALCLV